MNMEVASASAVPQVFISYSSKDRDKISPIVQIVRAMKKGSVFQDYADILPGERWQERVMDAIQKATTMVLFWCQHSAISRHVREEYEAGIEWRKEIIPILLDDTELPDPLRAFQWIDFRRQEPHGGLSAFVYRTFRRSGQHYYPKDEYGEYHDWESEEFRAEEFERKKQWEQGQMLLREEIARAILTSLEKRKI